VQFTHYTVYTREGHSLHMHTYIYLLRRKCFEGVRGYIPDQVHDCI